MSDTEAAEGPVTAQVDLYPPSPEEATKAHLPVEEEEVAYDEDPDDDQEAVGQTAPALETVDQEVVQQVLMLPGQRSASSFSTCISIVFDHHQHVAKYALV